MGIDFNEILRYEPEDGKLRWKVRARGRRMNRPAGTNLPWPLNNRNNRYNSIKINGKSFVTHHVIWLMHGHPIPDGMDVDHRNNITTDNRIGNLQLLTRRDNIVKTARSGRNTTSGHKGIFMYKKYMASVRNKGFKKRLGFYDTVEEAYAAVKAFLLEHNVSESEYISPKGKGKGIKRSKGNENLPTGVYVVQKRFKAVVTKDSVSVCVAHFSRLEEAIEAHKIAFIKEYGPHLYVES